MCDVDNDLTSLSSGLVKKHVTYCRAPKCEEWRLGVIRDMKDVLERNISSSGLDADNACEILNFACES